MLKHCFFGVWKTQYDFFSFETLDRMHKNIFFFFQIVFCILEVLMKTGYFNTGFVFLRHKIQTDIKKKAYRKRWKSHKILKIKFLKFVFWTGPDLPNSVGWAEPDPNAWPGLSPTKKGTVTGRRPAARGVNGGGAVVVVAGGASPSSSFPSSVFFFFPFLFLFSLFSLRCSLPLSVFPPHLLFSFLMLSSSVLIDKNIGEREAGAATVLPPHDCPRRHVSSVSPTHGHGSA